MVQDSVRGWRTFEETVMAGWFESLTDRGMTPALAATMSYTQARHRVIAENVANMTTPGYKAKRLELAEFQHALADALERRGKKVGQPLVIEGSEQVRTRADGTLEVTPQREPAANALHHDGTNMSIEREMADLAANAMVHEMTASLLQGKYDGLRKAIRGRA
mgnify:CR=1 FL=1